MEESEYVQVGEAAIGEAKRLQAALEERGVLLKLASDPENCGTCSPKIALFARPADVEKFQNFLRAEHARSLGDLKHETALADAVFDTEKEEATCPACGRVFSTKLSECPDCGLGFAVG